MKAAVSESSNSTALLLTALVVALYGSFCLRWVAYHDISFALPLIALVSAAFLAFLISSTDEAFLALVALFLLYPETSANITSGIPRSPLWAFKVMGGLSIPDNFFIAVACAYAIRNLTRRRWLFPQAPWTLLLGFGLWTSLSLVLGLSQGGDLRLAFFEFLNLNRLALAYLMGLSFLERPGNLRRLGVLILIAASVKGFEGLVRFALGWGVDVYRQGVPLVYYDPGVNLLLLTALTLVLSYWIHCRVSSRRVLFYGLLLSPAAFSFLFSYRRGQWLQFAVAVAFCFYSGFRNQRRRIAKLLIPAAAILALMSTLTLVSPKVQERLEFAAVRLQSIFEADPSNVYRYYDALNTIKNIEQHPVVGIGLGNTYEVYYGNKYSHAYLVAGLNSVSHNSFLYIWLKTGLPGLLLFMAILTFTVFIAARRIKESSNDNERALNVAVAGLLLGYLVYMNTSPGLLYVTHSLLYGIGLAYLTLPETPRS